MKIIEDNEKVLKIQRTRGIIAILFILVFVLMGTLVSGVGILVILLGGRTSLTCQKTENNTNQCQKVVKKLNSTKKETIIPKSIKKADIDAIRTNNEAGSSYSYGITLITETKEITLDKYFGGSRSKAKERVDRINDFIQDPNQKSLTIEQNNPIALYTFGVFFLFVGMGFIFLVGIE